MENFGLVEEWKFGWHMRERGGNGNQLKGGKKVVTEKRIRKGEIGLRSFWEWIEKFLEEEEVGKFGNGR